MSGDYSSPSSSVSGVVEPEPAQPKPDSLPLLLAVMWLQCAMWSVLTLLVPSVVWPIALLLLMAGAIVYEWRRHR